MTSAQTTYTDHGNKKTPTPDGPQVDPGDTNADPVPEPQPVAVTDRDQDVLPKSVPHADTLANIDQAAREGVSTDVAGAEEHRGAHRIREWSQGRDQCHLGHGRGSARSNARPLPSSAPD